MSIYHLSYTEQTQPQGLLDKMTRFENVKKYIESRKGVMITKFIKKTNSSFYWSCENNHLNKSKAQIIYRKSWCKKCSYEKTKTKVINSINDNFKLISYSPTACELVCDKNHKIKMSASHILEGNGCGVCYKIKLKSGSQNRMSIEKVKSKLNRYGFSFIDDNYKSQTTKHLLSCKNGHIFKKSIQHILSGSVGCPECNNSFLSEKKFRNSIEKIFNAKFPKSKPAWLINPKTNRRLELDCYNQDFNLAFEYDGQFHYEVRKGINNNLEKQKELDKLKDDLCFKMGIKLIRVPYYLKDEEFYNKIISGLKFIYGENYYKIIKSFELNT